MKDRDALYYGDNSLYQALFSNIVSVNVFMFSIFGWIWEVGMHLVNYGTFVNRGRCLDHGFPIYGAGGILILTVLNRFRKKPLAEFISIIVLCSGGIFNFHIFLKNE